MTNFFFPVRHHYVKRHDLIPGFGSVQANGEVIKTGFEARIAHDIR